MKEIGVIGVKIQISLFCLLLSFQMLSAQKDKVMNNPYVDHKVLHFGFSLGMHSQDLLFVHTGAVSSEGETWFAEIPAISPGFNVGLIGDIVLHQYINFRFVPTLYFGGKQVWFREWNSGVITKQDIRSNYLSVPFQLKFSSKRLNNLRPYLLAGVSFNVDLSQKRDEPLRSKPLWLGVELGVGSAFYFPYFRFCPELKFCLGVTNGLDSERTDLTDRSMIKYSDALSKITSRLLVLTFNFE